MNRRREAQYECIHYKEHDRDKMVFFGLRLQSSSWKKCSPTESIQRIVAVTFRCEFLSFYWRLNVLRTKHAGYLSRVKNVQNVGSWKSKIKSINLVEKLKINNNDQKTYRIVKYVYPSCLRASGSWVHV